MKAGMGMNMGMDEILMAVEACKLYIYSLSFLVRHTFHRIHPTELATIPAIPIIAHSNQRNTFRTTNLDRPYSSEAS